MLRFGVSASLEKQGFVLFVKTKMPSTSCNAGKCKLTEQTCVDCLLLTVLDHCLRVHIFKGGSTVLQ